MNVHKFVHSNTLNDYNNIQQSSFILNLLKNRFIHCHEVTCKWHHECYLRKCGNCVYSDLNDVAHCEDKF